ALRAELLDGGRERLVRGDELEVAGRRSVVDGHAPAADFAIGGGCKGLEELPGLVPEAGRLPAARGDHLPALDGPAVVVAANARNRPFLERSHDSVALVAVPDEIARADDFAHAELIEVSERRLEG